MIRNRLAPRGLNADPSANDADVYTPVAVLLRSVLRKGEEKELGPVTNTSETLQRKQCAWVMLELSARLSYN